MRELGKNIGDNSGITVEDANRPVGGDSNGY